MFPFTLNGPAFLGFYVLFAALVLILQWHYTNREGGNVKRALGDSLTADPYRIAYLRGAEEETVRLAVVNLVDRGLLEYDGGTLQVTRTERSDFLRRPLDRAILARCARGASPDELIGAAPVRAACEEYRQTLTQRGLLPDADAQQARFAALCMALLLLAGLAGARIVMALARGRTNIVFLLVLGALACWIAYRIYSRRTTASGSRQLTHLQALTKRLKARAKALSAGGASNEALLLAAVYGLQVLSTPAFAFVEQLYPKPQPMASGSDSGSNWSSSCGSSSSCGGGSGCGGCGGGGD